MGVQCLASPRTGSPLSQRLLCRYLFFPLRRVVRLWPESGVHPGKGRFLGSSLCPACLLVFAAAPHTVLALRGHDVPWHLQEHVLPPLALSLSCSSVLQKSPSGRPPVGHLLVLQTASAQHPQQATCPSPCPALHFPQSLYHLVPHWVSRGFLPRAPPCWKESRARRDLG